MPLNDLSPESRRKASYRNALSWLIRLRSISIISYLSLIALIVWGLMIKINTTPLFWVIISLTSINILLFISLRKKREVSALEIATNLTIDTLALALILYFSGGSTNPLVSLFIIPVALSAVFLPIKYIAWIVVLSISLYSVLMQWFVPLPHTGHRFGGDFNLHIIGMYGNFIFSAIIIAVFVYILARNSRKQEQQLADAREKLIRSQHVVGMGLLAANAAHEINTPLATIGLLSQELLDAGGHDKQNREDIEQIKAQVEKCRNHLNVLQEKANITSDRDDLSILEIGIKKLVDEWQINNPKLQVTLDIDPNKNTPFLLFDQLIPTLKNLLDNAANASLINGIPKICMRVHYTADNDYIKNDNEEIIIDIDDFGKGLNAKQLSQIGKKPYSTKPNGMGIGLLLSHTSLDQLGGHIMLNNHHEKCSDAVKNRDKENKKISGLRARIILPMSSFT